MLRTAIRACPEDLWSKNDDHANPYWRIVYHTLFYTDLYLQPNSKVFRPWGRHQKGIQRLGRWRKTWRPYTKAEVLAYWRICDVMVDGAVDSLDLNASRSGFSWYKIPKLEHQFVNLRHVQYHQAQLADRLRVATGVGVGWADARRSLKRSARRPLIRQA